MASTDSTQSTGKAQTLAFEQERQLLLESMATQLRAVLERVDKVNDNLGRFSVDQTEVVEVSRLWQSHHDVSMMESNRTDRSFQHNSTSLSVLPKSPRQTEE